MDYQSVRNEILYSPRSSNYASNVVTPDMPKQNAYSKDTAIADAINANPDLFQVIVKRPVKRGDFLRILNPVVGSYLFTKIKSAAASFEPLSYIVAEMEGDGLDVKEESDLNGFIALLQANTNLDATDIANINKVFHEKENITWAEVSIALRGSAEFQV